MILRWTARPEYSKLNVTSAKSLFIERYPRRSQLTHNATINGRRLRDRDGVGRGVDNRKQAA